MKSKFLNEVKDLIIDLNPKVFDYDDGLELLVFNYNKQDVEHFVSLTESNGQIVTVVFFRAKIALEEQLPLQARIFEKCKLNCVFENNQLQVRLKDNVSNYSSKEYCSILFTVLLDIMSILKT